MASFIDQPGAPVISVKSTCSENVTKVTLTQSRFFADLDPKADLTDSGIYQWQIPVALRTPGSKAPVYKILSAHEQTIDLPGCAPWVFANAGGRGYYRTDYGAETYGKISAEMERNFTPEERIQFLGDAWAMVRAGRLNIGNYLASLQNFANDRNRVVIDEAMGAIPRIHDVLLTSADRPAFEEWVRKFLAPIAESLGPAPAAGENGERAALRADVLNMLTAYGNDPTLLAKSRATAEAYMKDPTSVDTQLARTALDLMAESGDAALYDRYLEHHQVSENAGRILFIFLRAGLISRSRFNQANI